MYLSLMLPSLACYKATGFYIRRYPGLLKKDKEFNNDAAEYTRLIEESMKVFYVRLRFLF